MDNNSYPFRVLIVEDERDMWANKMKAALVDVAGEIDIAVTGAEARKYLRERHYHLVSLDQHMPDGMSEELSVSIGMNLTEKVNVSQPCALTLIFTAHGNIINEVRDIQRVAGKYDIDVLIKSHNNKTEGKYNAAGWAKYVENVLDEKYVKYYFKIGAHSLPLNLARYSAKITKVFNANDSNSPSNQLLLTSYYRGFWEETLLLCWIQSLALCHHGAPFECSVYPGAFADKEDELKQRRGHLELGNKINNWLPYLDQFIDEGSAKFRQLPNALAHQEPSDACHSVLQQMYAPMLRIMDAAAFWARYPLMSHFGQISRQGSVRGEVLKGTSWPWPEKELPLKPNTPQPKRDRIYLCWPDEEGLYELIDLWPWLQLDQKQLLNRPLIKACSHRGQNGEWYRRCLENGESSVWKPDQEEIAALCRSNGSNDG